MPSSSDEADRLKSDIMDEVLAMQELGYLRPVGNTRGFLLADTSPIASFADEADRLKSDIMDEVAAMQSLGYLRPVGNTRGFLLADTSPVAAFADESDQVDEPDEPDPDELAAVVADLEAADNLGIADAYESDAMTSGQYARLKAEKARIKAEKRREGTPAKQTAKFADGPSSDVLAHVDAARAKADRTAIKPDDGDFPAARA